jgi:hypothetical protein
MKFLEWFKMKKPRENGSPEKRIHDALEEIDDDSAEERERLRESLRRIEADVQILSREIKGYPR